MAMFFYIYPDVGASFALIAYVVWRWADSAACSAPSPAHPGRARRGDHRDDPAAFAQIGGYLRDLSLVVFVRPRGLFGSL